MNLQELKDFITEDIYIIEELKTQLQDPEGSYSKNKSLLKIKGNKTARIAILFHNMENEHISLSDEEFLVKILKAVKLSLADIMTINTATNPSLSIRDINSLEIKTIISFTGNNDPLNRVTEFYCPHIDNDITYLLAHPFTELVSNAANKKKLWEALQQILF